VDYLSTSGVITFLPGSVSEKIDIDICGDTFVEPNENFSVALSGPTNAIIGDASGIMIIENDD
jgi:Calx-beta domain